MSQCNGIYQIPKANQPERIKSQNPNESQKVISNII